MAECHQCGNGDGRTKLRTVTRTEAAAPDGKARREGRYLCISCSKQVRARPSVKSVKWREGSTAEDVRVRCTEGYPELVETWGVGG